MARCPAHDDREPSLSITVTEHDKVLGLRHAAGEQHRVIAAPKAARATSAYSVGTRHGGEATK
jgi:hypothetical protein